MKPAFLSMSAACFAALLLISPHGNASPPRPRIQPVTVHPAAPPQRVVRIVQPQLRVVHSSLRVVHAPQPRHRQAISMAQPVALGSQLRVGSRSNGVTTRNVYLWSQPAKIEPHIQQVDRGRPVQVVGQQVGFYAVVLHNGRRGWVPVDAVRPR